MGIHQVRRYPPSASSPDRVFCCHQQTSKPISPICSQIQTAFRNKTQRVTEMGEKGLPKEVLKGATGVLEGHRKA